VERVAGLEEFNGKGHEEIVKEQVDWKFQYWLVGRVVNGEHAWHGK
jgi:hypothetical protein